MPQKTLDIADIGNVTFYKRRGAKSIRVRINGPDIKVTLPNWAPYSAAISFVEKRKRWILDNVRARSKFVDGAKIGSNYYLRLHTRDSERFYVKERGKVIEIYVPNSIDPSSEEAQKRIEKYITAIFKRDAEDLLIPLANKLAVTYGFEIGSLEVKKLKSRWGSCNSRKDIVLNLYLIQLPAQHIEYVIFHELAHTVHLNHSKDFWALVGKLSPNYKEIRKDIKQHSPDILVSTP